MSSPFIIIPDWCNWTLCHEQSLISHCVTLCYERVNNLLIVLILCNIFIEPILRRHPVLNSLPIDELGDGVCRSNSGVSNEPWDTSPEQGTQASTATLRAATTHQAPSHWSCQWRYLTLYLPSPPMREGREGEKAEQLNKMLPETDSTSNCRNEQHVRFKKPCMFLFLFFFFVCHLNAHDSLTTADQHWLDFNLA